MNVDVAIVGGGLQGGLIALALRTLQPQLRLALIEKAPRLGGNHTWSFHAQDIPEQAQAFLQPLVSARWPGYSVRFPGFQRRLESPYASILSEQFHEVVVEALRTPDSCLRLGTRVVSLDARTATLDDGTCYTAGLVIDARGSGVHTHGATGFQKFLGWEIELQEDWPEVEPVLMDATVPQEDGYRFFYTLPFSSRRVLIEDTVFSDSPELDAERFRGRLRDWIRNRTQMDYRVAREEHGVLPMPWGGDVPAPSSGAVLAAGAAGGWYHPATGYSFPLAVRLALALAQPTVEAMVRGAVDLAKTIALRYRFSQFLNALLFCFVDPEHRWTIFRRLYRALPCERLSRFYAMNFTAIDSFRMIVGWPPRVAPLRALRRWLGVASNPLAEGRLTCSPPSSPIR